jgi:hypothetical protein
MSNFREYDTGEAVRIRTTFTLDDVPTDPTTVTLYVRDPSGNTDTHNQGTLVNPSTGVWYKDVEADEPGTWSARMVGTGTVVAVAQEIYQARRDVTA